MARSWGPLSAVGSPSPGDRLRERRAHAWFGELLSSVKLTAAEVKVGEPEAFSCLPFHDGAWINILHRGSAVEAART
jgi:hypothetical protein